MFATLTINRFYPILPSKATLYSQGTHFIKRSDRAGVRKIKGFSGYQRVLNNLHNDSLTRKEKDKNGVIGKTFAFT